MTNPVLSLALSVLAGIAFSGSVAAQAPAPAATAVPGSTLPTAPLDATGWTTPHPPYPDGARKAKMTGTVRIRVLTDRHGMVHDAKIVQSSGHPELDDATVKYALTNWHGPAMSRAVYLQNFYLR